MSRAPHRTVAVITGLVLIVAAPGLIDNQFYLLLLNLIGVGGIVTVGLNLVLGYAGQVSLGHAALFGVGAYAAAICTVRYEQGFLVGAAGAITAAVAVGVALGVPSLRLAGAYLAMATMAFNLIVQRLAVNWVDVTGGPDGLSGIPPAAIGPLVFDRRTHWYLVVACAVAVYWLAANLVNSGWGRALLAVREDELAASASGVPVHRAKLTAFAISAGYAGLGGALFAHLYRYVSPISFGLEASIEFLLAVLIGGPGRLLWPLLGVAVVTVVPQLPALQALQDYRLLVYGGLLLASVVVFRDGVGGAVADRLARPRVIPTPSSASSGNGLGNARWSDGGDGLAHLDVERLSELLADARTDSAIAPGALELVGVGKQFGGVTALESASFAVEPGTVHGLIGPNGSGKTTCLNIVSGVSGPDRGVIRLSGRVVSHWPAHRLARLGVARTFQTSRLFGGLTVVENVLIGGGPRQRTSLVGCMLHLPSERLDERRARRSAVALAVALGLGPHLESRADHLPHGLQRRVELARALALRPRLLLLDEPAAGLGEAELDDLAEIVRNVRRAGISVLLVEHHVDFVLAVCDRLTVLDQGRVIADGDPLAVVADQQVMEAYLGRALTPRGSGSTR